MHARYLKRLRLEIDLRSVCWHKPVLDPGFRWRAWEPQLLASHAQVKFECFAGEIDSRMFPAFSSPAGCEDLMRCIMLHEGFLPRATWLMEFAASDFHAPVPCGTVQGLMHSARMGSIQNLGVLPEFRGQGLGRALVWQALAGFATYGVQRVYLDVTAANHPAVELYRSLGFRHISSRYLELPEPVAV